MNYNYNESEHIQYILKIQRLYRRYKKRKSMKLHNELATIINKNVYIRDCKSNKKKDEGSLSSLITRNLSQSDCIKLGNAVERVLYDIVMSKTEFRDIKPKNTKGKKEKDHLFCDEKNKRIIYAELKSNINLDTEKSKSTSNKCLAIVEELKSQYINYTIEWCLLGCRYLSIKNIPKNLRHKYKDIDPNNHLFGVNDYLKLLNINITFTKQQYSLFLNDIANKMFE